MSMLKFFKFPFAVAGDKTTIPDPVQGTGAVSYSQGFGPDYELDPLVDPNGKDVPRDETNQLFYDVTNAIREYQTFGTPDFITTVMNGGTPYAYAKNARVLWSDGEVYESKINSNTDLPTVTASWRKVSGTNDQTLLIAVAGGTANALTATFSPSLTALLNGVPLFIRCAAPNTTDAPTLNVDGLGVKTICKGANVTLVPGDIAGSGFWAILQYDATLDKFVLANPAQGAAQLKTFTGTNFERLPSGLIIQWGPLPLTADDGTANVTWATPFPNAALQAYATGTTFSLSPVAWVATALSTTGGTFRLTSVSGVSAAGSYLVLGW